MTEVQATSLFPAKKKRKTKKQKTAVKTITNTPKATINPNFNKELETIAKRLSLSENATQVLEKRYLIKDKNGNPAERPEDLFIRVAKYIAQADLKFEADTKDYEETAKTFLQTMVDLDFLPNSPTLRGAGREIHQLSACFVLPIEDEMESIFDTLKVTSLVHKGGGGTGFSFGHLRPKGDKVGSTDGVAGGPISFMRIFDTMSREVMQGGVRVGANMGILPVDHPDIKDFITCKQSENAINNFNLSVSITDKFMEALEKNSDYELINPRNNEVMRKQNAKEVFDMMVKNAWSNGDPGVVFIDEFNKYNPTPHVGKIEATNPCGEQPLLPYESCNLGSINLSNIVVNKEVDFDKLKNITKTAVHFLDNVIEMNKFADPKIEEQTKGNRKIGLGVMGWADMLAKLEIAYNSTEAEKLAEKIMKTIVVAGRKASEELATTRGEFPNFKGSIYDKPGIKKLRNATITTIAPTGTLSLIANCGGGIEPFFALVYKKKSIWRADGTSELEQIFVNEHLEQAIKEQKIYSKKLMEKIAESGSLKGIEEIPENIKKIFVTSHDITPEWHIRIQAAFQKYTDNAVSKTINFPNSATIEDIANSYKLSYKLKCKGITIYRDGSRQLQVFTKGKKEEEKKEKETPTQTLNTSTIVPRKRPDVISGRTYKTKTAYGSLYVTINEDEHGNPFEVFAQMGKSGGFFAAKVEAISRLISLALRSGISNKEIINQLKGIRGPSPIWTEEGNILSLPDALAKVLEKHINRAQQKLEFAKPKTETSKPEHKKTAIADLGIAPACPECGSVLELGEGCLKCPSCGFSKCG